MISSSTGIRETKKSDLDSLVLSTPSQAKWNQFGYILLDLPNYLLWNVLVLMSVTLNFIFVTIDLVFPQESYECFLIFYVIFDIFYLLNFLVLVLHKSFYLTSPSNLSKSKYSLIIMIIDFLSLVPQFLLLLLLVDYSFGIFIPLLRITSILRMRHLLLFRKVLGRLLENRWKWFAAQYATIFCLSIHTANCIWFLIRCDNDCNNKLNNYNSEPPRTPVNWYLHHIYYSLQVFLNIGFGDTFPKNFNEIYLFSMMELIGQALTIWLICYITWFVINHNYNNVCVLHKIKSAIKYVHDTNKSIKSKISEYYSMKEHNTFKYNSLSEMLPPSLKQDISFDLNCGLLHRSMILKELPKSILKRISLAMKPVMLPAGDSIYFQYVIKTSMVCIEDGILEVLNDEDQESPVIFFRNGTILGEVALFYNCPSKASVRAARNTELRILEKRDFLEIMQHFPEHFNSIQTNFSKRLISVNKPRKTIQKFCLPSLRRLKVKLSNIFVKDDTELYLEEEYYHLYRLHSDQTNIIAERNGLLKSWILVSNMGLIMFCLLHPYYAVFEKSVPSYLHYFGICTDIACLLDIIFQSTTTMEIEGKVITRLPNILDVKLNDWKFNLDILSLFPIEVWSFLFENTTLEKRFFNVFKFNRLLRLHKIPDIIKIFTGDAHFSIVATVVKIVVYGLLSVYYSACILYLSACFGTICDDSSWYYLISRKTEENIKKHPTPLIDSVYFAVTSVSYTGPGDILPKSANDFCILTILILIFLLLKSYWLGEIVSSMFLNTLCSGYLETKYYLKYLSEVNRVPSNLKLKIVAFLKINRFFYREKGQKFIHETVPNSLEDLIKISRTDEFWKTIKFFDRVDPYFLALIENEMKLSLLPKNEIVYSYGDFTRRMFVIKKGYCELYNPENSFEKTVGPGSQLGLLEMIYCLPKKHTVVTKTDCILFFLDYFTIDNILKMFPKEHHTVESVMFQKDLLECVAKLEMMEDAHENNELKNLPENEEHDFFNISKKWTNYCKVYRKNLGPLWVLGFFLIPVTINPDSSFLKTWCIIRSCFIVIEAMILSILIITPPFFYDIVWIAWLCHITLYIDMYISLHIGYYDGKGVLKIHPAYTSWHYLTHSFLLDLMAAVHWKYFNLPHFKETEIRKLYFYTKPSFWDLLKLIQFFKVFKCINYFLEDYFKPMEILKMLKLIMVIILISNIFACIGIRYIYQYDLGKYRTGVEGIQDLNETFIKIKRNSGSEYSIYSKLPSVVDTSKKYIISLYTVLDWLTSTGTGYFIPTSAVTKIAATLTIIFGIFLFTIVTSVISTIMLAEAEESIDFRDNVLKLFAVLAKYNISNNLKQKILGHFKLMWNRTKTFNIDSKTHINAYLRDKILMNFHEEIYCGVSLLYHFDMSYIKLVLNLVRIRYFQKGEVIINFKDVLGDIFIVTSGQVEIFSEKKETLCLLGPAAVFGNMRNTIYSLSTVYIEARRNVELWTINTESFYNTVKYYPLLVQELERILKGNPAYLLPVHNSHFGVFSISKDVLNELESDEEELDAKVSGEALNSTQNCAKFIFKPDHFLFDILDFLVFIASLTNILIIPYIFVTQETHYLGHIYLCLEPIFYIRIFFKLHKSYMNVYGNIVTSKTKICKRYLNTPGQIFWDIVPNLPVTLIFYCFPDKEQFFFYTALRLFHLLRFFYIIEYFQVIIGKLFRNSLWYLARIAIYYIILVHIFACTWFMLACPFNKCTHDSWLTQFSKEIFEKPAIYKVILSYYYVLNLATTTGIGNISPKSYKEMVFTIITMLSGKLFISVVIGTILNLIYISEKQHFKFERRAKWLRSYLRDKNISDFLLERTSEYLENVWAQKQEILESSILDSLSYPLQQDIMFTMYGNQIAESFLFKEIDQSLLLQICTKLKHTVYFKDDYIVKTGDLNWTMYFIHTGNVVVLTKHPHLTETKHVILRPMDLFGVSQGLNLEECHNFDYRASTSKVEILSLIYEDWSYLLDFFPKEKQQIFVRVHKEYNK